MNFISKNLKKSRYFNLTLIVIAFVLCVYCMIGGISHWFIYITTICGCVGLVSAFIYAVHGYKKESAMNYKVFMLFTFVTFFLDACGEFMYFDDPTFNWSMVSTYANFARVIPMFLLTFILNFGEKRSKICSYIVFALSLFIFVRTCIIYSSNLSYVTLTFVNIVNSSVAVILVNAKYADKTSRGTK